MQQSPAITAPSSTPFNQSVEERILLSPIERLSQARRNQLNRFRSSIPLPCLWVTAHIPTPIPRPLSPAYLDILADSGNSGRPGTVSLDQLRIDLAAQGTPDSIANAYLQFLQKQLMRLNNKLLKHKTTHQCFHFRGTLERNAADSTGRLLHYHFALWAPTDLFRTDPALMQLTRDALIERWHRYVNNQSTRYHTPIHVEIITKPEDADNIALYEGKTNSMNQAYEIFDDWSLAGCRPVPA